MLLTVDCSFTKKKTDSVFPPSVTELGDNIDLLKPDESSICQRHLTQ